MALRLAWLRQAARPLRHPPQQPAARYGALVKRSRDQTGYRSVTEPGTSCYCIGNSNSQRVTATRYCNAISSHCVKRTWQSTRVGGRGKSNKDASLMWRILDCCRNLELIIDACNSYQGSRGCTQLLTVLLSGPSSQRRRVTRVNKLSPHVSLEHAAFAELWQT